MRREMHQHNGVVMAGCPDLNAIACVQNMLHCYGTLLNCSTLQVWALHDAHHFGMEQAQRRHTASTRSEKPKLLPPLPTPVNCTVCTHSKALAASSECSLHVLAHALLLHEKPLADLAADWTLDLLEDVNDNPRWRPFLGHLINEPSEGEGHPNVEWIENLDVRPC